MVPETPSAAFVSMCMNRMLDLERQVDSLQRTVAHLQQATCKLAMCKGMCRFNDGTGFNLCLSAGPFSVTDRVNLLPLDEAHLSVQVAEHPVIITWDMTPYGHGYFMQTVGASGKPLTVKELLEGIFEIYNAKLPASEETTSMDPEARLCDLGPRCAWFAGLNPSHHCGTMSSLTLAISRSPLLPFD